MSLNCRPGDLARIVHPSEYGRLVVVLYAAPATKFTLPDGQPHCAAVVCDGRWVCEAAGDGFAAMVDYGSRLASRKAKYVVIADRWLRPIRDPGDDAQDESFRWAPAPEKVLA